MRDCESNYSMWTFSGGFRTWVKMSLVRTSGKNNEAVEFRQEVFMSDRCTHTYIYDGYCITFSLLGHLIISVGSSSPLW